MVQTYSRDESGDVLTQLCHRQLPDIALSWNVSIHPTNTCLVADEYER